MAKLSPYLCVQYMRFFWKATPDSADHTGVKCKIMRPVSFTDAGRLPLLQCRTRAAIKPTAIVGRKGAIKTTEDEPEEKRQDGRRGPDEDLAALALSMEDDSAVKHQEQQGAV